MNFSNLIKQQRQYFNTQDTKALTSRKIALLRFKQMLEENEAKLYAAVHADFHKSEHEAFLTEIAILIKDIDEAIRALPKWSKAKKVQTNLVNWPGQSYVVAEPYGTCLVIGAWNYPIQLSFAPAIAALAAGNTVILKPSELAAESAACMAALVAKYFKPELFCVVQGGVDETTSLLEERFDKIFFTGSPAVGKVIYQAAARQLTPVTLELGGKSPAILTPSAHLPTAIKRLVWAKFLNAGQTCIAPDYVFVHASIYEESLALLKAQIEQNAYDLSAHNYVQIINERNLDRLERLLQKEKIACGGKVDRSNRTIEPTILRDINLDDAVMQEEIFGPLLPLIAYSNFQDMLQLIQNGEKPLSAYLFSNNPKEQESWLNELSFGGGCINDAIMHITNPNLPFGGVGQSGTGSYHGKAGFDTFSRLKPIFHQSPLNGLALFKPPFGKRFESLVKFLLK